ncbi:MAG: hypothetical protein IJA60_06665 [Clostridia bacterium]|nr:hypothetical protein [Clostridia bacterium]
MKKRILALVTVLLFAVLMIAAVSAAPAIEIATPAAGTDLSALTEGQTFDVYITVGPFAKIGTSSNANVIYRVAEDSTGAKAPAAATNKLTNMKYALTWSNTSLEVSSVTMYTGNPSATDQTVGDFKIAYLAKTAQTAAAAIQHATVTGVGSGTSNTGNLTIDYGTDATGGYMIRGESAAPAKGVVAVVTFRVVAGATGGEDLPITMTNTYTYDGSNKTINATSVTVSVVAGCAHESKTALTPEQLTAAGKENVTATCLVEGVTWYQCNDDCGEIISVTTNKLDHDFSVEKYVTGEEPDCYEGGKKAMYCSTEGCTEYDATTVESVAVLGHDFSNHAQATATCEVEGYDLYWCTRCYGIVAEATSTTLVPGAYYIDGKFYNNTSASKVEIAIPAAVSLGTAHVFEDSTYVELAAECEKDGYEFYYCNICNAVSPDGTNANVLDVTYSDGKFYTMGATPEETDVPAEVVVAALGHTYEFDSTVTEEGVTYNVYACVNGCGSTQKISADSVVCYVANAATGTGDGSSAENATTIDKAFEAFAAFPEGVDCTIYLVGTVKLFHNPVSANNTAIKNFEEARHDAHVTITSAPGAAKGTLFFPFATASMYYLSGPTTFDDIYISSDATGSTNSSSQSTSIYGRGFPIVFTENVEMASTAATKTFAYTKTGGNWGHATDVTIDVPSCKIYLCGGFYPNGYYPGANYETYTVDMTINGGTFFVVVGGSRKAMDTKNCTFNISIGPEAKIAQLAPINVDQNIDVSGTVVNMHYYGGTIALAYRSETQGRTNDQYTVNHFFHNGSGVNMTVGDFMMGASAKHWKNVNCYYSISDTNSPSAEDYAMGFIAKGNQYADTYYENQENLTFRRWCVKYAGGHDYVDGYCTFCDTKECKTATDHEYIWDTTSGELTFYCDICGVEGSYSGENNGEIYVSDNGKGNGGFSADYPLNDFETALKLAAAYKGGDATIYVVGSITVDPNFSGSTHTVFAEPAHDNTITICGYNNLGVFKFPALSTTGKTLYALNGDTIFKNIEFSNWNTSRANDGFFYLAAQHNKLVLGENVTIDWMRNTNQRLSSCAPVIVGGCYHSQYHADGTHITAANCPGGSNDVTIYSGTYYEMIGGSVGGPGSGSTESCGDSRNSVTVRILGDVSFRDYVALGGFERDVKDITFVLDGSLSVGNYFSIVGVNKTANLAAGSARNVSIYIYDGTITSQSFQSVTGETTLRPLGGNLRAQEDGTYDITANLDTLTIYYDPSVPSAKDTAFQFNLSPHSKTILFKALGDTFCEENADGEHDIAETVEEVESTCAKQGYGVYICDDCDKKYTVVFEPVDHTFGDAEVATPANCINPEIMKEVCSECGFIQYSIGTNVATGEHDYDDNNVCVNCSQNLQDLCEHEWDSGVEISTGCGIGVQTTCEICGKVNVEVTSANHNFGKYTVTTEPTATEPGVKTRTCKSCGKVETALLYAEDGAANAGAIAVDASGNLADFDVVASKLSKTEKAALNALLQDTAYGSEVKVSYETDGNATNITYSIPLPAEYADMKNLQVIVKDDEGKLHTVEFTIEKGYIVFTF